MAVDDVAGDTHAGRLAGNVVDRPGECGGGVDARGQRSETGIVEGGLLGRVDAAVGRDAGGAIELVDVAPPLVDEDTATLAGAVRKDDDVAPHARRS